VLGFDLGKQAGEPGQVGRIGNDVEVLRGAHIAVHPDRDSANDYEPNVSAGERKQHSSGWNIVRGGLLQLGHQAAQPQRLLEPVLGSRLSVGAQSDRSRSSSRACSSGVQRDRPEGFIQSRS
jgi:hypothetical protein